MLARMGAWFDARFQGRRPAFGTPRQPAKALALVPMGAAGISAATGSVIGLFFAANMAIENPRSDPHTAAFVFWFAVALASLGLIVGCAVSWSLVRRWRRERLAEHWSEYVISDARQRAAAQNAPDVAARLAALNHLIRRLREHPAVRGGWLPGVTYEALDRVHFILASELLNTVDLRAAVIAATSRPALASQVAVRKAELTAADAAFDAQLEHLAAMSATADRIGTLLGDLALAERLDAGAPSAAQLRGRLTSVPALDVEAMAAAATEAAHVVAHALDPRHLYPAPFPAPPPAPRPRPSAPI
jgi:MFS family permease